MSLHPNHFGHYGGPLRADDSLFQRVESDQPLPLHDEEIPLPEVTESDFAAFDALQNGSRA